jgi:hypothetical protein
MVTFLMNMKSARIQTMIARSAIVYVIDARKQVTILEV